MKLGDIIGCKYTERVSDVLYVDGQTGAVCRPIIKTREVRLLSHVVRSKKIQLEKYHLMAISIYWTPDGKRVEARAVSSRRLHYRSSSWRVRLTYLRLWTWASWRLAGLLGAGAWSSLKKCLSREQRSGS